MHTDSSSTTLVPRLVRHPLIVRHLRVCAVRPVAERLVRITLTGADLAGFVADGPGDHVKLLFPDPATGEIATPALGADGSRAPAAGPVVARDYTPFEHRPEAGELDIDFVLHGDEGPASAWAARARPGDRVAVAGPRGSHLVPEGLTRLVLVVDETAFPAAARWLRATSVPTVLLLTTAHESAAAYFDGLPGVTADRDLTVGLTADPEAALRALAPFDPSTLVVLAGEASTLVPLRRYLRRELGLPAAQVDASGYWKRDVAALDHHAPLDPTDPD